MCADPIALTNNDVTTSLSAGSVQIATRTNDINYYNMSTLNLMLGSGNDLANVRGTATGNVNNVNGNNGEEHVFANGRTVTNASGIGTASLLPSTPTPSTLPLVVFGGAGQDEFRGRLGDDLLFGDQLDAASADTQAGIFVGDYGVARFIGGVLAEVRTTDGSIGTGDIITGAQGSNVIFGGAGADRITTPSRCCEGITDRSTDMAEMQFF